MVTSQVVEGYKYMYSTIIMSVSLWISLTFERQNARGEERQRDSRNQIDTSVMSTGIVKNIFAALNVKISKKRILTCVVLNKDITKITMCV